MAQITSLQIEQLTVTGFSCFADERRWTFGRMTTVIPYKLDSLPSTL